MERRRRPCRMGQRDTPLFVGDPLLPLFKVILMGGAARYILPRCEHKLHSPVHCQSSTDKVTVAVAASPLAPAGRPRSVNAHCGPPIGTSDRRGPRLLRRRPSAHGPPRLAQASARTGAGSRWARVHPCLGDGVCRGLRQVSRTPQPCRWRQYRPGLSPCLTGKGLGRGLVLVSIVTRRVVYDAYWLHTPRLWLPSEAVKAVGLSSAPWRVERLALQTEGGTKRRKEQAWDPQTWACMALARTHSGPV